jgi:hypothetical protein
MTPVINRSTEKASEKKIEAKPYKKFNSYINLRVEDLYETRYSRIAKAIKKIIEIEGPIHISEVSKRLTYSIGMSKVGSKISSIIKSTVDYGHRNKIFYREDNFLFLDTKKESEIRDRSKLSRKNINFVPIEEIKLALEKIISISFSVEKDEAISEASSLIGFNKVTSLVNDRCQKAFHDLEESGVIEVEGKKYFIKETKNL